MGVATTATDVVVGGKGEVIEHMAISAFERRMYELLIDIKQEQGAIRADMAGIHDLIKNNTKRLDEEDEALLHLIKKQTQLEAGAKAWVIAAASVGGIVGWFLTYLHGFVVK